MTNYKNTLNLPNTKFSMRGNLVKLEPNILRYWYEQNLYEKIRQAKKGKQTFILHDGPPYANGNIHIGHAVNKILKDIIFKYKGLMGYDAPCVPGWDCHGLPIELKVEQIIGKPNTKNSIAEFRIACRNYAAEQVSKQKKDFIRLGILEDWKNPYLTMDFMTEANTVRVLSKLITKGHIYKGVKPVHWCLDCQSSLAEAEVEYHNRISPSIYVNFRATDIKKITSIFLVSSNTSNLSNIYLVIWTTNPWTLPANQAIAIHPNIMYQLIEIDGQGYIIAANLVEKIMALIYKDHWKVIGEVKGSLLEMVNFHHPFMKYDIPTILSYHVTLTEGTGAVHIAPNHGPDDYIIGLQYGLKIINLVNTNGYYSLGTHPLLDGVQIFKANEIIINLLRSNNSLLFLEKFQHRYLHCWRHKTPVIFLSTPQWFININQHSYLHKQVLAKIHKVKWIPKWVEKNIQTMVSNRPDWCISRQRIWGVPMTLFIHNKTETLHPHTVELMEIIAKMIEKDGVQAWWDLNPIDILGKEAAQYRKVLDTLDVWFDSGSTHYSVVKVRPEFNNCKPDMYLEGSDQHRGWFMSSLIITTAITNAMPYKQVLTHGFVVDSKGHKMSKSLGNIVSPQQIVNKMGADILRLWVASTDYTCDIAISDDVLKRTTDLYRRIRNTARFLLANLSDFDPAKHSIDQKYMIVIDIWAVSRAQAAQVEIIAAYEKYHFHNVVQRLIYFCSIEMSSFYLDIIKDRQYTTKADSIARRSCQTALYHIIEALTRWIAPILSFTSDEIWRFIPGKRSQFVFTEEWYQGLFNLDFHHQMNDDYWQKLLKIRNEINKMIEKARINKQLNNSLEASIILYADSMLAKQLLKLGNELNFVFLTSEVQIKDYSFADHDAIQCEKFKGLKISLNKAKGKKCLRCWHYKMDVGQNINYPEICNRCITNIFGIGEKRNFI